MHGGSQERRRKFYGWGYEGDEVTPAEMVEFEQAWTKLLGVTDFSALPFPTEDSVKIRDPRVKVPASLQHICATDKYDRLYHTYGSGTVDVAFSIRGEFRNPPDAVAYPRTEDDIVQIYRWCENDNLAAVPYGGGTSVVGGVNPPSHDRYRGVVSIDMKYFNKVLEIDKASQSARIQAGILGPDLERQLKPSGLTMRFFLQAWEFSSLGGWIATRAAGHFATVYTQIDDHVQSLKVVTPSGNIESRRFPTSGAGPNPDRLFLGSEGALGIITEAWVRLHKRPVHRQMASVRFADYDKAVEATRVISQANLYPASARLVEREEAVYTGSSDGSYDILVLGFESADRPVDALMKRALEICGDHGGKWDDTALGGDANADKSAKNWRDKFLRGPYLREYAIARGVMRETMETCVPWSGFAHLREHVKAETHRAIREVTGRPGSVTCRFTHIYPDGPAPYFTWFAYGDKMRVPEQYMAIKKIAEQAMVDAGGTVTHHHALGRDHRPWYDKERPELFCSAMKAAKDIFDPKMILNPGILFDPS
ncbi:FAD linked oxidase, C-:FAD linked oxidase [Afipia carboxidovorans OM5]|uniref:FAD/FMN-containing dehydrogenase n=1 Tax=Afipia carboxidovorans (strain ATCC 49405 / DSM 1227 / KCTC 32145 / OM5) TaxID=504832 RepID=B6JB93_AFIC5|nr:FAD-binding oxidoreductase [Afipia carboxidovorans]ACI92434.1 FAD linked oxidase, C-:FAD linked oxidase [Afipia carboxidovorans OM5]AEI03790.1 FAD/FMN-containing dehydrogenase [Afipia carboxidovorans OM4]AEI07367.1 FAD/FMN-containing dehydrogenase [Afipia carboxidovorans OM5]